MCFEFDIHRHMLMLKQMVVSLWMTSLCAQIRSWRYHWASWLNWFMEVSCRYWSFTLPWSAPFDWSDLWRFYWNDSQPFLAGITLPCLDSFGLLWFLWIALFARISFPLRRKMQWSGIKTKLKGLVSHGDCLTQ